MLLLNFRRTFCSKFWNFIVPSMCLSLHVKSTFCKPFYSVFYSAPTRVWLLNMIKMLSSDLCLARLIQTRFVLTSPKNSLPIDQQTTLWLFCFSVVAGAAKDRDRPLIDAPALFWLIPSGPGAFFGTTEAFLNGSTSPRVSHLFVLYTLGVYLRMFSEVRCAPKNWQRVAALSHWELVSASKQRINAPVRIVGEMISAWRDFFQKRVFAVREID